jgi:hypothetical protein
VESGIHTFGTAGSPHFTVRVTPDGSTSAMTLTFTRCLYFDRDIDGGWLVWAAGPDGHGDEAAETGAFVVRDPVVTAFLEQLGQLLLAPRRFAHEPVFAAGPRPGP